MCVCVHVLAIPSTVKIGRNWRRHSFCEGLPYSLHFKEPGDWAVFVVWIQDEEMLVDCINDRVALPAPVLDTCTHVAMFQIQVSEDCVLLAGEGEYRESGWKPPHPHTFPSF